MTRTAMATPPIADPGRLLVITADRRGSREAPTLDMAAERDRLEALEPAPLLPWEISAGDELQAAYQNIPAGLAAALELAQTGAWHVGLGLGSARSPLPRRSAEATGPAFFSARQAVEQAKQAPSHLRLRSQEEPELAALADPLLALIAAVRAGRTDAEQQAARLLDQGITQQQAAEQLGLSQSSVSRRLSRGHWAQEDAARRAVLGLLLGAPLPALASSADPEDPS